VRPICEVPVHKTDEDGAEPQLRALRWPAAATALTSAALHAAVTLSAGSAGMQEAVTAVMAVICVVCAGHLVLRPHGGAWAEASVASAAMLVVHPLLMGTAGHAHHAPSTAVADALAWSVLLAPAVSLAFAFYGFTVWASAARPAR
jgi:hypothetical protein